MPLRSDSENFALIRVIGVGGGGSNAVNRMIRAEMMGVEFIACNTDAQALLQSDAPHKIRIGDKITRGLGAGGDPGIGQRAAEEDSEKIYEALKDSDMVFITAGMGGGTGTGAAPVVAEVAREMGILTVAVVSKPFAFEGRRMRIAEAGMAELAEHVDSLIVILNEKLMEVLGEDVSMKDAFRAADDVLYNAVAGISEIINSPGLVNVDFEDVRTVMAEMGMAMMGSAYAAGIDRARVSAEQAVASPLLEGINLAGARGVVVNITASDGLKMREVHEVMRTIQSFAADDAHIIFGAVYDEAMGDNLRVTVVATGLGNREVARSQKPQLVVQRTGTDNAGIQVVDYGTLESAPAVFRKNRSSTIEALSASGVEKYDIPAFLRKQAD